jgi:deazaflavin-dependent oxidoreductase (nitroreductase family)
MSQTRSTNSISVVLLGMTGLVISVALLMRNRQRFPTQIRTFNKHVLNPLTRKFADFPRGPFAVIHHVGRRSGKAYETPIIVQPVVDGFVIALTYGPEVDWYRNVLAAGHCTVLWHGKTYATGQPEPIDPQAALPAFHPFLRPILRILDMKDFVKMKYQSVAHADDGLRLTYEQTIS